MSQPALRQVLTEDHEADPRLTEDEKFLANHLAVVAAVLTRLAEAYPELLERQRREGQSDEVRAAAHEMAEQAATVLQALRRRQDLIAVAQETPMNPSQAIAVLDELFFSYCLLSGPDDARLKVILREDEPRALIDALGVREWLELHGTD
jgi:hypothetical protein